MKSPILLLAGLVGVTSAYGQAPAFKAGVNAPIAIQATFVVEGAPVVQTLPNGGAKKTYAVTSVKYTNREILDAMRLANLLDGTLSGWTLARFTDANDVGNVYAVKVGKTAVAIPAALLTQPVLQAKSDNGVTLQQTSNSPVQPNLTRRVYSTLTVKGGSGIASGSESVKSATIKKGETSVVVIGHTDSLNLVGKAASGNTTYVGTYKVQRATAINLAPFFPGNTVP